MDKHTDGQMVGQMNKWMGDLKDRCMYVCMGGWRDVLTYVNMSGSWVGGWMVWKTDGWIHA